MPTGKALVPRVIPVGSDTAVIAVPKKASSPIFVTELGIVTLVNNVQLLKA